MIVDGFKWIALVIVTATAFMVLWNLLVRINLLSETKLLGFTLAWILALWLALPVATFVQRRFTWLRPRGTR